MESRDWLFYSASAMDFVSFHTQTTERSMFGVLTAGPYNETFFLGLGVVAALAWWEMARRRWPSEVRAALIASVTVTAIIGSRWLPLDGHMPLYGEKTVLGALVGAAIALAIAGRLFRIGAEAYDIAIPAVPIGMAIGRVGCFLAGCCFGLPTTLPWGVRYAAGSIPFNALANAGVVPASAAETPPLHPAQLYEAIADIILAALVTVIGRRLRSRGASALAFGATYATARFGIEFVRFDGSAVGGLKPVQWGLAAVGVALLSALVWREHAVRVMPTTSEAPRRYLPQFAGHCHGAMFGWVAAIVAILATTLLWATPLELASVFGAATFAIVVVARRFVVTPAAPVPLGACAMLILLQGGGAPPDSTYPRSYSVVGAAAMFGKFKTTGPESCNAPEAWTRDHTAYAAMVSAALRHETSADVGSGVTGTLLLGMDAASVGRSTRTTGGTTLPAESKSIVGGSVAFNMDGKWSGLTLGIAAGELYVRSTENALGLNNVSLVPIVGARFGRLSHWYVESMLGELDGNALPAGFAHVGIGIATDSLGSRLGVGVTDLGPYVSYRAVTNSLWEFEPLISGNSGDLVARFAIRRRFAIHRDPR